MGCSHKIVLREDMFYGEHVLRGTLLKEDILQKNLSQRRTFLVGKHVLWEDMSYCRIYPMEDMFYGWICLTGRHVLLEACLKGGHVLEDKSFRKMFLWMT